MNIMDILDREGLRIAPAPRRILAFIIDDIIVSLVVFAVFFGQIMALSDNVNDNMQMMNAVQQLLSEFIVFILLLKIGYHTLFTTLYGASIGKIICKIKIVRLDTLDKPNILQSFARSSLRTLGEILFYIPLLLAFADSFQRALHDMLTQTIVIDVSIPQDIEEV